MYLVLLGLFHFGFVLPWVLFAYDASRATWFSPYGLFPAMKLVLYSIVAYQVGLLCCRRSPESVALEDPRFGPHNRQLFIAGFGLFAAGIVMFIVGLIGLDPGGYLRMTYSESYRLSAESDPRFFGTGIMIAAIGLNIAAAGATRLQLRFVFAALGIWVSFLLYWGFRGPALLAAVVVCAVGLKKNVQYPRWLPWVAIASLLVLLPVIRVVREQPAAERFSGISLREFNLLDGPAEMGASIRPLIETVAALGPGSYRMGGTYWVAIKGIVPNLALHWTSGDTVDVDELPPNLWITAVADPWLYNNYGGIGFSAVAEPYMNFGVPGVIVYFFLLAVALVWFEQVAVRNSYTLAAWALILEPLLWTTRNDFTNFFRPAVWGLVFITIVWIVSGGYNLVLNSTSDSLKRPEALCNGS